MKKASLSDQIVALATSGIDDGFPEDIEDHETGAKVVDIGEEDETTNLKVSRSFLRAKNAKLLEDLDERYAGSKTSRKRLGKSFELPSSKSTRFVKKEVAISNEDEEESGSEPELAEPDMTDDDDSVVNDEPLSDIEMAEEESDVDSGEGSSASEVDGDNSESEDLSDTDLAEELSKSKIDTDDGDEVETISALDKAGEIEKGKATQQQLRIWDTLLEARIRMQKMLLESNKLPQTDSLPKIVEASNSNDDMKLTPSLEKSRAAIKDLLEKLVELQETIINQNPETVKSLSKKRKAPKQNDNDEEEIPSDEEITSSEDEAKLEESDVEDEEKSKKAKLDGTGGKPKRKKRKIEEYEQMVQKNFDKFVPYRNETIQKWNDKTQLSFGKFGKKNASAHEVSTLKQIQHILSDKHRLIKRTQVKRGAYSTIGKSTQPSGTDEPQQDQRDEEIFDDDDFYHQLLRELIERKTNNLKDPVQLSRHWLELQKLRSKLKRKVDTKASKGRKIRYDVHSKLVNFMAPVDNCSMSSHAVKELMNSLFGESK